MGHRKIAGDRIHLPAQVPESPAVSRPNTGCQRMPDNCPCGPFRCVATRSAHPLPSDHQLRCTDLPRSGRRPGPVGDPA
jgi:hypothetical protein